MIDLQWLFREGMRDQISADIPQWISEWIINAAGESGEKVFLKLKGAQGKIGVVVRKRKYTDSNNGIAKEGYHCPECDRALRTSFRHCPECGSFIHWLPPKRIKGKRRT